MGAFDTLRRRLAAPRPTPTLGPCLIYGAGGFGRRIAAELCRLGHPVRGFIDHAGRERTVVDGLPCRHPDDLAPAEAAVTDYVHGLMNHTTSSGAVADWAANRGFRQLLFATDLLALPGFALENYWLAPAGQADLDALERLHDRLADAPSRALLRSLVAYRASTDPRAHPPVATADIYQPDGLPIRGRPLTFVDGGAYTGDTLAGLLDGGVTVAEWLAFEPDPANGAALRAAAGDVPRARLFEAGLSDHSGRARFQAGDGAASRVTEAGATEIALLRLDDVLEPRPDLYVKLDVEGGEAAALRGMAGHLARRPVLAVSVYHRPEDLWALPELVEDLYPEPRLRLRQHGHHGFDTVLYVTPE